MLRRWIARQKKKQARMNLHVSSIWFSVSSIITYGWFIGKSNGIIALHIRRMSKIPIIKQQQMSVMPENDVDNGTSLSVPTSLNLKNEISAIILCLSMQCIYDSDHHHHHHHQENNTNWSSFSCVAITFSASIGSTVRLLLNSIHLLIRV